MQDHLQKIVEPLLAWFAQNKRSFPWREDRQPYHVWISEIMLQQTRIEVVKKRYVDFIRELPDLERLSLVDDDRLLKLWEGLGYYSRAKNLKKAAQLMMQMYGGDFPRTYAQLIKLPGIGEYTAGAIASICFNERVPAVDGNVLRVITRVTGDRRDVLLPATKKDIAGRIRAIMPAQAGDFNEALMELGETVCLPNGAPDCERCPLRRDCAAYRDGLTDEIPLRVKKQTRRKENKTVLVMAAPSGSIAIEKRPDKGLLSGLYQLPNLDGFYTEEALRQTLMQNGIQPVEITFLKQAKHVFTHIDWIMRGYRVLVACESDRYQWASARELDEQYALPTAFQIFLE